MNEYRIGQLVLGKIPRIVGTISSPAALPSACQIADYQCDIAEVRLDEIGANTNGWLKDCQDIEATGLPVILTLRLASEGGKWTELDSKRKAILSTAMEKLACIDIEMTSKIRPELCKQAADNGKQIIVSSHNFSKTPKLIALKRILNNILAIPCAIPKISTMINNEADVDTLMTLLDAAGDRPVCVIGMGSKGVKTRVLFPSIGSCLTYGYIDSPSAPGQLPTSMLIQQMRLLIPEYNQDVIIRKEILEFA